MEPGKMKVKLEGVEETLLIPLWGRALETRRPDALFRDERAVAMVEAIDYDFSRFNLAQAPIAVRTELLDRAVGDFIARHPDATIVNLGAGLDTRFFRLDNGRITWYEVDLPRSMALRRRLIPDDARHRYVEGSVLEPEWMKAIAESGPVLVIIEGLLMYFEEAQVRALFARLAERFPGAEVLFEAYSPLLLRLVAWQRQAVVSMPAAFHWGLWHGRRLETWVPGLRWLESWSYYDQHPERWGELSLLSMVPFFRSMLRIEHVRLP